MKIISFCSYPSVWHFAFAEAAIAYELKKKGHEILFITPGYHLGHRSRLMHERTLRKQFDLPGYDIGAILTAEDMREINSIITTSDRKQIESLTIDGVAIGRIALYETLLHSKKMNLDFSETEWAKCLADVRSTLESFFACRRILEKERPDSILMYNALYSVNRVWERYADLKGIPAYFLHHGLNLSDMDNTLIIAKTNTMEYFKRLKQIWPAVKDTPSPATDLSYVTDHFLTLLTAKHFLVYSSAKAKDTDIRRFFGVSSGQKIITATMSSYDEMFASQYVGARKLPSDLLFASQTEWVAALIEWVRQRPELFLVIRVHPREFPNKRDPVKSEHVKTLEAKLRDLPANVRVNWPNDDLSLYDLAQETDVFLNAWSSVGVEMSLLGLPVVIYSGELVLYPSDINYLAASRADYFTQIDAALSDGWRYERIRKTYRWLSLYYCKPIVRFRDGQRAGETDPVLSTTAPVPLAGQSRLRKIYKILPIPKQMRSFLQDMRKKKGLVRECGTQRKMDIDTGALENMLRSSGDTLVDIKAILERGSDQKAEDAGLHLELRRLYKAMYGIEPEVGHAPMTSLQNKLRTAILNP